VKVWVSGLDVALYNPNQSQSHGDGVIRKGHSNWFFLSSTCLKGLGWHIGEFIIHGECVFVNGSISLLISLKHVSIFVKRIKPLNLTHHVYLF
jgi:hypothetical protein